MNCYNDDKLYPCTTQCVKIDMPIQLYFVMY